MEDDDRDVDPDQLQNIQDCLLKRNDPNFSINPKRRHVISDVREQALITSQYAVNSNESINIHFVTDAKLTIVDSFHPTHTYQFFESEVIIGYKNLQIDIYFNQLSLKSCYKITYGDMVDHVSVCNVKIARDNIDEILSRILYKNDKKQSLKPEKFPYKLTKLNEIQYFILDLSTNDEIEYFRRAETFSLLFIESADRIVPNSNKWKILMIYTEDCHKFIGFITLYHFTNQFRHVDRHIIVRICQFLVLPPYQHKGYGRFLMDFIYSENRRLNYLELTVESPNERFEMFRDLYDIFLLSKTDIFNSKLHYLTKDEISRLHEDFRITEDQIIRAYEIYRYYILKQNEKNDYRLMIKERFVRTNKDYISCQFSNQERKKQLEQLYKEVETIYTETINVMLEIKKNNQKMVKKQKISQNSK